MTFRKMCAICVGLTVCICLGCQQKVSFPPEMSVKNVGSQQVIVEGRLTFVKHQAEGELVTLDYSQDDSRPKGELYPSFLVLTREIKGPQHKGESRVSQVVETTTEVIPTRYITSITFFEKGMTIQPEL